MAVGAATALIAVTLSGCSIGAPTKSKPVVNPTSVASSGNAAKFAVPPEFDSGHEWSVDESGRVWAVAPRSAALVDVSNIESPAMPTGSPAPSASGASPPDSSTAPGATRPVVLARALSDGHVIWASQPLSPLVHIATPEVSVVNTPGGEYAVLVRRGATPEDVLVKEQQTLVVDSYPLASVGSTVVPVQHLEIKLNGGVNATDIRTMSGDGGLMLWNPNTPQNGNTSDIGQPGTTYVWDPFTGSVTPITGIAAPACQQNSPCPPSTTPLATTALGLFTVVRESNCTWGCTDGFNVGSKWSSAQFAPPGYSKATPLAVTRNAVVAAWWSPPADGSKTAPSQLLYTVQDISTGAIISSVTCASKIDVTQPYDTLPWTGATTSPNGRYLEAGALVADLTGNKVWCFAGNDRTEALAFWSVTDSGIAYAQVDEGQGSPYAEVNVSNGQTTILANGTSVPWHLYASQPGGQQSDGLFVDNSNNKDVVALFPETR